MKTQSLVIFVMAMGMAFQSFAAEEVSAEALLKASDRARGSVTKGLQWDATIITIENGETTEREFKIKAAGDDAYVETKAKSLSSTIARCGSSSLLSKSRFRFPLVSVWWVRRPMVISPALIMPGITRPKLKRRKTIHKWEKCMS